MVRMVLKTRLGMVYKNRARYEVGDDFKFQEMVLNARYKNEDVNNL